MFAKLYKDIIFKNKEILSTLLCIFIIIFLLKNKDKWTLNLLNIFNSILRGFMSIKTFNTFVGSTVSKMSLWMFIRARSLNLSSFMLARCHVLNLRITTKTSFAIATAYWQGSANSHKSREIWKFQFIQRF